jgi:hypothetical protein
MQRMAFMRSGRPMLPLSTVEDAAATATTAAEEQLIADMRPAWIVDEPVGAVEQLRAFAERFGADEVMIAPAASAHEGEDLRRYAARERTLELVAEQNDKLG